MDADPAYHAADEGGADNEDDVGPFECPEGLTNITTLIKRSGPLPNMLAFHLSMNFHTTTNCSEGRSICGFERAKDLISFLRIATIVIMSTG